MSLFSNVGARLGRVHQVETVASPFVEATGNLPLSFDRGEGPIAERRDHHDGEQRDKARPVWP